MTDLSRLPLPSAPRNLGELVDELGGTLDRMVAIEMEALPQHWTEAERRELAERRLFGEGQP